MLNKPRILKTVLSSVILFMYLIAQAQDERSQIPSFCNNFYFEVNIGYINYHFSAEQLEPAYTLNSIKIPHAAVRIMPVGYEFNKYLAIQLSYMRPVLWVHYTYSNGPDESEVTRAVWMNVSGLTVKPQLPLGNSYSVYGEGGMVIVTRNGFEDDYANPVVSNANYPALLLGGGLKYHINKTWMLMLGMVWTPENKAGKQPAVSFYSAGFCYKLHPLNQERIEKAAELGYVHPKQMIQVGLTSNILGYGVNNLLAEGTVPVFWGGEAEVAKGLSISYQRNFFHGASVLALDWGTNISFWQSNENKENFFTLSLYPILRATFLRTKSADIYLLYSIAGPTYMSRNIVDSKLLGMHFTFQDYIGIGTFFGSRRKLNIETKIGHYSNGDIFPVNEGVKVPLSLNFGYAF